MDCGSPNQSWSWKKIFMNDSCESCKFWILFRAQPSAACCLGECRRHSPRVFQAVDGKVLSKWPTTRAEMSCGDYKAAKVEDAELKVP